jgi:hypothetical protein
MRRVQYGMTCLLIRDVVASESCSTVWGKTQDMIFSDLIEKVMEVFMDNFSVYGKTFEYCLANLDKVLRRCQEADLVLNWE